MKFLFDDESFSYEALRAVGYTAFGGAEIGEVLVTCRAIPEGDVEAWSARWAATAARVEGLGREALAGGHPVSGREALLRASNYYRTADFYRREDPSGDAESARLATRSRRTFSDAMALTETPVQAVRIPYEDTTLPGYLYLVDDSSRPRPTVVFHGGFDSTLEESWSVIAAGALRRGYHVLAFDGPGQGTVIRDQGLPFRPDWEAVVSPAVDLALTRPEVDGDRIALVGMSLGGYLAARAAAFEPRLAACVLYDGVYDLHPVVEAAARAAAAQPDGPGGPADRQVGLRWMVDNGRWTFGAADLETLTAASVAYALDGVAHRIRCPTLVLEAENDQFFAGQPQRVFDALRCPKTLIAFPEDEGGGEHCHAGAIQLFHQRMFDWLDDRFGG